MRTVNIIGGKYAFVKRKNARNSKFLKNILELADFFANWCFTNAQVRGILIKRVQETHDKAERTDGGVCLFFRDALVPRSVTLAIF